MPYLTAKERDAKWLKDNGVDHLNIERFSDWVTRLMNDGFSEQEAREYVKEEMVKEL